MHFYVQSCLLSILLVAGRTSAIDNFKSTQAEISLNIVSRLEWKADEKPTVTAILPASQVIISHTASKFCRSHSECTSIVQQTQKIHIEYNGWDDIAYNFLVGGNGLIYEGRGWDNEKGHKFNLNRNSIDIAFIGNFNEIAPTEAAIAAVKTLIEKGIKGGKISKDYKLFGQRQRVRTDSPGEALYNIIKVWDHWTPDCTACLQSESSKCEGKIWSDLLKCLSSLLVVTNCTTSPNEPPGPISQDLRIIDRKGWLAQAPTTPPTPLVTLPAPKVIISHTASNECFTQSQCVTMVRTIQTFHIESRGWSDIAYNFLVGGDGLVYQGRGWDVQGDHTFNYNRSSIGIAFIGTFNSETPTKSQLEAAKKLLEFGIDNGKIAGNYSLLGQRQCIKTESPGDQLYNIIKTWDHWTHQAVVGQEHEESTSHDLRIINREGWLAQPPNEPSNVLAILPAPKVIIIHTASNECFTQSQCVAMVRSIQTFHIESRGWSDIAYNFLVGGDGLIYEGRGWDVEGAHTFNYNRSSIGIAFIGTFNNKAPTKAQLEAAKKLIEFGVRNSKISINYELLGHRQCIQTESPGDALYDIIKTWDHWTTLE